MGLLTNYSMYAMNPGKSLGTYLANSPNDWLKGGSAVSRFIDGVDIYTGAVPSGFAMEGEVHLQVLLPLKIGGLGAIEDKVQIAENVLLTGYLVYGIFGFCEGEAICEGTITAPPVYAEGEGTSEGEAIVSGIIDAVGIVSSIVDCDSIVSATIEAIGVVTGISDPSGEVQLIDYAERVASYVWEARKEDHTTVDTMGYLLNNITGGGGGSLTTEEHDQLMNGVATKKDLYPLY